MAKLLVANRGEIACRVMRTAQRMGIATVAVYSDADAGALHVRMADEAVRIGPAPAAQSYLSIEAVLDAVRATGAEAVHPGYGFLSENPAFAAALEAEGVAFVGPPARAIEAMGDKIASKRIAAAAGVSVVPGHAGEVADAEAAVEAAAGLGYPVMLKASAGGGGKGMRIAYSDAETRAGFAAAQREAQASFGDGRMFVETFVTEPRHIEIQVLADRHGRVIHLGERECSIQRRNQKVIEEAPSPFLDEATRAAMGAQACALAASVGYASAGTVEFIVGADRRFYFLEMNTRLQVEHPVTELVTGIDIVEEMIRIAAGEPLRLAQAEVAARGWAIEARVYAEDPLRGFLPSTGRLRRYRPPAEVATAELKVRNDTGVFEGGEISVHYDPMIAKLCAWGPDREAAAAAMAGALDGFEIEGIGHNLAFLSAVIDHPRFRAGALTTAFIAEEYPGGFAGVTLGGADMRRVVAAAAVLHARTEARAAETSGRMDGHVRQVGADWVVVAGGTEHLVRVEPGGVTFGDGAELAVETGWRPGDTLARLTVGGAALVLKVAPFTGGFRLRTRGADIEARVLTPRTAELAKLMPVRAAPDTSRLVLSPMPGRVVAVEVAAGDAVEAGQALASVEAMKMENVLRAERRATVARVAVAAGDLVGLDDVILEFEA